MGKIVRFKDDLFDMYYIVYHRTPLEALRKEYNLEGEGSCGGCFFDTEKNDKLYSIIWLWKNDPKTIAHECVHAAMHLFKITDQEELYQHEEAFATYVSWLYVTIRKKLRGRNDKGRKRSH